MNATTTPAVRLDERVLDKDPACGSYIPHRCTVIARWAATSTCDNDMVLWCDGRYRLFRLVGWFFTCWCDRTHKTCWRVVPL